jgi:hypothetical protein
MTSQLLLWATGLTLWAAVEATWRGEMGLLWTSVRELFAHPPAGLRSDKHEVPRRSGWQVHFHGVTRPAFHRSGRRD